MIDEPKPASKKVVLAVHVSTPVFDHSATSQLLDCWEWFEQMEESEVFPTAGNGHVVFENLGSFLRGLVAVSEQAPSSWGWGAALQSEGRALEKALEKARANEGGRVLVTSDLFEVARQQGSGPGLSFWSEPTALGASDRRFAIGSDDPQRLEQLKAPLEWRPNRHGKVSAAPAWILEECLESSDSRERWTVIHGERFKKRQMIFYFDPESQAELRRKAFWLRKIKGKLARNRRLVRLYDFDASASPAFVITERESGEPLSLEKSLFRFRLPIRLHVAAQVVSALAAAHQLGIIHGCFRAEEVLVRFDSIGTPIIKIRNLGLPALEHSPSSSVEEPGIHRELRELGLFLYRMVLGDLDLPLHDNWRVNITDPRLRSAIGSILSCFRDGAYRGLEHVASMLVGPSRPAKDEPGRASELLEAEAGARG